MTETLRGAFPALVTPMRSPGELDLPGVAALVERALSDGARGVLVAGSTGEGTLLSPADRRALTVAAKQTGATVIAGASAATLEDVHADVERLAGAGADAVLVLAPHTLPLQVDELVGAHVAIAERASVPTLTYHIPQFTGSALTPEAVTELSAHPGMAGMKDSSDDADRRRAFVAAAGSGFAVFTGHGPTLVQAVQDGVAGSITAIANVRQRQVIAAMSAAGSDDAKAAQLQVSLRACENDLRTVGRSMPAVLKAALQLEGILDERWCARPLSGVEPGLLDRVRTGLMR